MPSRRRALASSTLLAALVLGACSGGGSGDGVSSGAGTATTSTSAAVTTSEATTSTTEATTTTTEAPTTTTTAAPVDPTTVAEEGALRSGSVGSRTKAIQVALEEQGYDPGEPDGKFGTKTTQAVWAFQALNGVPKDGIVGPETEAAILAKPAQQMLRPALGPTHVEVDLTRQVLIVWRDGAVKLITHVSTGSGVAYCEDTDYGPNCGDAVTPVGVFQFGRRVDGWREAPLGRLYNPVYFHEGYAVHGASSVPDHPASHGCVRIPMGIAAYFPSLVDTGETIEVFRS
ncbi:MAG: L,D-transpeptidase family protein [Acidimicrobiales bacterium]